VDRRENVLKKYLLRTVGTRWDVQSHEDQFSEGIPDLSFGHQGINGWIELKQIATWPFSPQGLAKPQKFTSEQVNWLLRRGKKGGHCFILVKVGKDEYFLFDHAWSRNIRAGMTYTQYYNRSRKHWKGSIDPGSLLEGLISCG